MSRLLLSLAIVAATSVPAFAETVNVAVAANFTAVAEELARIFEAKGEHQVALSFGATGQLYTQITQAAPFGIFLAADEARPQKAIDEGFGVDGTFFIYAEGRLVLYAPGRDVTDGVAALEGDYNKLAIADPAAAPYGKAAVETLTALGLLETLTPKLVQGENISQTLQFVESGNAELGFVAASQVLGKAGQWLVPGDLHEPIAQGAVLLKTGETNPAALAFFDFLKSDEAVSVIEAAGYSVP
ncbi:molybdate ABC transporter substrate-binding protein [Devosia sp. Root685]|uniref:molybdate ABC transporter substrate-binding protein n=1 Tax=Devosia sp. Root685 TaxID=1736587 RepID=UPI0006FF34FC|nr:molybdate ABC transporter substrate-binding protein [Devosia sp. Root685]KRA98473.1 molybdate ABC transporter substrate-binding protein [Devosia sp. Root685]